MNNFKKFAPRQDSHPYESVEEKYKRLLAEGRRTKRFPTLSFRIRCRLE